MQNKERERGKNNSIKFAHLWNWNNLVKSRVWMFIILTKWETRKFPNTNKLCKRLTLIFFVSSEESYRNCVQNSSFHYFQFQTLICGEGLNDAIQQPHCTAMIKSKWGIWAKSVPMCKIVTCQTLIKQKDARPQVSRFL